MDWGGRLRKLNKALRNKLKSLNEMLEKELDKVYIKSLNPKNVFKKQPDVSYQKRIADRELENAQKQYELSLKRKMAIERENKKASDPNDMIELEEQLKFLKERKKALVKEVTDLTFDGNCLGKQLERANKEIDDPNEADNLLYKLKALKKKKEALETRNQKHQEVMAKINDRVSDAKLKADRERRKIDDAERKNAETAPKSTQNQSLIVEDTADYSTNTEEADYQKGRKALIELKRATKDKKLELEKLFIELHERDKENRLLNLKVKELARMVPQNRLNPVSRDRSSNVIRRRKRMKNSSIAEANNSVLVTKKDHRMSNLRAKGYDQAKSVERVKRVDSKKKSISEISKVEPAEAVIERKESFEENDNESPKHVKIKENYQTRRKQSSDSEGFEMGKGLNGEPSMVKVRDFSFNFI